MGIALGIFRALVSTVHVATKAVLLDLDSGGDGKDRWPEAMKKQPAFGAVGLVFRQLRPTKSAGQARHLEVYGIDDGGGVVPVAYRDLRLNALYPAPKEGDIALVGYAGAFDSNSPKLDADGKPVSSERVIYVPYAFVNGVATKAHTIEIIGTAGNESISIIHGEGMAVTMTKGGKNSVVIKNKSGNAYVEVNDEGVTVNGNTTVNGGATIGSPIGALPAAVAAPLIAWAALVNGALNGLGVPVAPLSPSVAATKTSIA